MQKFLTQAEFAMRKEIVGQENSPFLVFIASHTMEIYD